jgi:negative regulator of flagellin synthesis FlgM
LTPACEFLRALAFFRFSFFDPNADKASGSSHEPPSANWGGTGPIEGGSSMKIQGRKNIGVGAVGPISIPGQAAIDKTQETSEVSGDSLEISSASREVSGLREAAKGIPDVRMEKMQDIRGQVEEGSYYVESEKLAKAVVDEALQDAVRRHRRAKELKARQTQTNLPG